MYTWKTRINASHLVVETILEAGTPIRMRFPSIAGEREYQALPFVGSINGEPCVGLLVSDPEETRYSWTVAMGLPQPVDIFTAYRMLLLLVELDGSAVDPEELDFIRRIAEGSAGGQEAEFATCATHLAGERADTILTAIPHRYVRLMTATKHRFELDPEALEREWEAGRLKADHEGLLRNSFGMRTLQEKEKEEEVYAPHALELTEFLRDYAPKRGPGVARLHRLALLRYAKQGYTGFALSVQAMYVVLIEGGPTIDLPTRLAVTQQEDTENANARELIALYRSLTWAWARNLPSRPESVTDMKSMVNYLLAVSMEKLLEAVSQLA